MNTQPSEYEQQAIDFLTATGTKIDISFLKNGKHFEDDKDERDIYKVTIKRGRRQYTVNFGNSINKIGKYIVQYGSKELRFHDKKKAIMSAAKASSVKDNPDYNAPSYYDILATITKYDPGTFEDFCSDFGYDTDSKKAEKTYLAVKEEYENVAKLFTDSEIEKLQEIQ